MSRAMQLRSLLVRTERRSLLFARGPPDAAFSASIRVSSQEHAWHLAYRQDGRQFRRSRSAPTPPCRRIPHPPAPLSYIS